MFLSIYVNRVRIFLRVERGRNMKFVHLTKDEFDSFEEKCPDSTFWQTSAMGIYKEKQGCSLQFVGVKEADMILAASCIIGYPTIGKMYIYHALRGFLIDYTNEDLLRFFVTELKKTCSSKMVYIYISIHMCNMFKEIKMPTLLKVDSIIKKSLIHLLIWGVAIKDLVEALILLQSQDGQWCWI